MRQLLWRAWCTNNFSVFDLPAPWLAPINTLPSRLALGEISPRNETPSLNSSCPAKPGNAIERGRFNLPEASDATLTISNAEGRTVKVLSGAFAKGLNTVTLLRSDLTTGLLFYQLDTPTHSATRKMVVAE